MLKSKFNDRSTDWWIFTLLPIILIIIITILFYWQSNNTSLSLSLITKQLFSYCIVLSSTDIGLRKNRDDLSIGWSLLVVIIGTLLLAYNYIYDDNIIESIPQLALIVIISIIISYFSIFLYNTNPESNYIGPGSFSKQKKEREKKSRQEFEPDLDS